MKTKHKNIYTLYFLLITSFAFSQVGIGTVTPHSSAVLDMDVSALEVGSKKGFLLPRVSLNNTLDTTTIPDPVKGLWVYNLTTTTGANNVTANTMYNWDGSKWDAYISTEYINERIPPEDYFVRSYGNYKLNSTSTPTITSYNNGTLAYIPWEATSVLIDNPNYIAKSGDYSFQAKKQGNYEISGVINYNPAISSTSTKTTLQFILQKSPDGSTWENISSVNSTFEYRAGNTLQSIPLPYQILSLNENDYIRFVLYKKAGDGNHGSDAGISSPLASVSTKSFRISYLEN